MPKREQMCTVATISRRRLLMWKAGADWINALPDEVLQHVISFLPAKQAVRTCVLAQRWRHLWKPMKKKKALPSFLYLVFVVLLPWGVSFSFNKCLELWIKNWWNTRQSQTLLTAIQEERVLERFMELEDLFILDEMIKEKPNTHVQKPPIGIRKEMIQLAKIDNEGHLHIILHFSTNIICLAILSGSFFLGKEELVILNSWVQEFFYNLNDLRVFHPWYLNKHDLRNLNRFMNYLIRYRDRRMPLDMCEIKIGAFGEGCGEPQVDSLIRYALLRKLG